MVKIGFNNVDGLYANCRDCPYFEEADTERVSAFCHYMGGNHGIDKFDIYRCQRIVADYEQYVEFCASVGATTFLK